MNFKLPLELTFLLQKICKIRTVALISSENWVVNLNDIRDWSTYPTASSSTWFFPSGNTILILNIFGSIESPPPHPLGCKTGPQRVQRILPSPNPKSLRKTAQRENQPPGLCQAGRKPKPRYAKWDKQESNSSVWERKWCRLAESKDGEGALQDQSKGSLVLRGTEIKLR